MLVRRLVLAVAAVAAMFVMIGAGSPAIASAAMDCPHRFGAHQQLTGAGGAVVQEWSVADLRESTDTAPGYPVAGRLWEATVSVSAVSGTVTPIIPNFQAASAAGVRYPVLWQLASPAGLSGATISQGQESTGKLYFDVTGADPTAVIYTTGGPMPSMMWCCGDGMMSMPMGDCPMCRDEKPCACCAESM
jgi:hypothetical protein